MCDSNFNLLLIFSKSPFVVAIGAIQQHALVRVNKAKKRRTRHCRQRLNTFDFSTQAEWLSFESSPAFQWNLRFLAVGASFFWLGMNKVPMHQPWQWCSVENNFTLRILFLPPFKSSTCLRIPLPTHSQLHNVDFERWGVLHVWMGVLHVMWVCNDLLHKTAQGINQFLINQLSKSACCCCRLPRVALQYH